MLHVISATDPDQRTLAGKAWGTPGGSWLIEVLLRLHVAQYWALLFDTVDTHPYVVHVVAERAAEFMNSADGL